MILIIDGQAVIQRILYTGAFQGNNGGIPTSFMQSALLSLNTIASKYPKSDNFIICWDSYKSFRKESDVEYKRNRADKTPEEKARLKEFFKQLDTFKDMLRDIGIEAIEIEGLEGDDVIAMVCKYYKDEEKIVVSPDRDLYQLLDEKTTLLRPSKNGWVTYDKTDFIAEWGITPDYWPDVKAIAGCNSDNVLGLKGVGEKTAIKILQGTREYDQKIVEEIMERNLPLVLLPYNNSKLGSVEQTIIDRDKLFDYTQAYVLDKIDCDNWLEGL